MGKQWKQWQTLFSVSQSVQSLSHVRLFAIPWTAARQASLSITNSQSLLKLMSFMVMTSNHLILCHPPLILPSIFCNSGSFSVSQFFVSGGQSIGVSASTSILPMNTQDWSPLGWTVLELQKRKKKKALLTHCWGYYEWVPCKLYQPANYLC